MLFVIKLRNTFLIIQQFWCKMVILLAACKNLPISKLDAILKLRVSGSNPIGGIDLSVNIKSAKYSPLRDC